MVLRIILQIFFSLLQAGAAFEGKLLRLATSTYRQATCTYINHAASTLTNLRVDDLQDCFKVSVLKMIFFV